MRGIFATAGVLCAALTSPAPADTFGWFPGSTVLSNSKTGDRVVVVNLDTGEIESPTTPLPGWQYSPHSPGADPFTPGFTPDGEFVYMVSGGDANAGQQEGHILVYDVSEVIASFRAGTPLPLGNWLQDVTIPDPPENDDAVEPVGFTVAADGSRAYLVEGNASALFSYDIQADGTLNFVNVLENLGETLSPFWISPDGNFGFICSTNGNAPTLNILSLFPTPELQKTVSIPLPSSNEATFAFASCAFPMDPANAPSITVQPYPTNPLPVDRLFVFSGHIGIQVAPGTFQTPFGPVNTPRLRFDDPVNIYELDISIPDANVMELTNGGDPVYTIDPNDEHVVFPPIIQSFDNGAGVNSLVGGSILINDQTATVDRLLQPASEEEWFPTLGHMPSFENAFYIGGISEAVASIDLVNPGATPSDFSGAEPTSVIFRTPVTPVTRGDVTLQAVAEADRSFSFVLGEAPNDKLVVGASDTFLVVRAPDSTSGSKATRGDVPARTSLFYLLDPDASDVQSAFAGSARDLGLVAGAYGQGPDVTVPVEMDPEVTVLEGTTELTSGSGVVDFGTTTLNDPAPTREIIVRNDGNAELTTSNLMISDGPWVIQEGLDASIAAGAQDTITIELPTTTANTFTATVSFDNNDSDENPFTFDVTGVITTQTLDPDISVVRNMSELSSGAVLNIGTTDVGTPAAVSITVVNDGGGTLNPVLNASFPADTFTITDPLVAAIDAGFSDEVTIQADATVAGMFSESFTITSNDPDESPFNLTVEVTVEEAGGGRAVGDFNDDGCTNLTDFLFLASNWMQDPGDGTIGLTDFLALASNWMQGPSC